MWQRKQSLFLLLAIIFNILSLNFNLAKVEMDNVIQNFSFYGLQATETGEMLYSTTTLVVISMLSSLVSLITIFAFKKRQLQIKMAQLNLFVHLILIVSIFFMMDEAVTALKINSAEALDYGVSSYLVTLPLLFIYLAIRGIKKDEALVRAADRIR